MYKEIGYYHGKFGLPAEMTLPFEERGFIFGEAVYEFALAYNKTIWTLDDHLDRLEQSLAMMDMPMPMSREAITAELEKGLDMVEDAPVLAVYIQITRGAGPRTHSYHQYTGSVLYFTIRPMADPLGYMQNGLTAITAPDQRWHNCFIKTTNLIPNIMAATNAYRQGAYTTIFYRDNLVTEAASCNAYIVKDGVIYTAPLSDEILHGVTRAHLVELLPQLHIPLVERSFTLEEMYHADEVFLTATTKHPAPLVNIDGKQIADGKVGPICQKIHAAYEEMIARVCGTRRFQK